MRSWSYPVIPTLRNPEPRPPSVFDTASRSVRPVGPESGTARLYVCGITPYDATHLGHANTYVSFDLLHRVWLDAGLDVLFVQNVTDVDDPLLERADATGVDWEDLADEQVELFRADMVALRVIPPDHYEGAVESIPTLVALLDDLRSTGRIYQVDDPQHPDWYFHTVAAPGFGHVAGLDDATMRALFAERGGDPDRPGKLHPLDCLVWRMERPDEPAWESPLGHGRPGWHIECTAIALRFLGAGFDVQGGGSDLAFPHHEMCAAEGGVVAGQPFAQHFVHTGMVGLDGEKMSKSRGNLVFVSRLREAGVDPMAIRLALLAHHYRADWEWTAADLTGAQRRLTAWREAVGRQAGASAADVTAAVRAALLDDLDAPTALAALDSWAAATTAGDASDPQAGELVRLLVDALLGVEL